MRIVVVEDIEQQAEWLCKKLRDLYGKDSVDHIRTESDFHEEKKSFFQNPPDLVLMDMMLRWADPSPRMPPAPPEVNDDGRRAGLRCVAILRSDPRTARTPIIIRTVLEDIDFEENELPPNTVLITKESDDTSLFRAIDETLGSPAPKS